MIKNLNEDQRTNLIQDISDRLQDLSVSVLREILSSLKTQEEKKFNGNIAVSSIRGSSLHAGDFFDNINDMEAKLILTDPNNKKKVERFLSDYARYNYKVKFESSEKICDVYHCIDKDPSYPLVVYLYRE